MINAISHTLVHSLWQGALLSAITGSIMTCTRKSSPALRYNLLVSAMVLFAVGVAGTFCVEFNEGRLIIPVSANQHVINSVPILPETIRNPASPGSPIIETVGSLMNRYGAIIVWIWFLMVCARCIQLATGLRAVHHLRHKNTSGIGSYWEERVRQLCGQLGIKRLVGIAQSGRAKTPMAIGHLKPLILVPLGMLTSLSAEEVEAVLLHELAHIRRADYLVNLLQNVMEIIFFFNPGVLWLSALIKAERENCCDDIAVVRSGKVNYLKALVACEEYKMPLTYAMTLKVGNRSLKGRIARIISNKNQSLNNREKSLLAVCLIATGIFAAAFTSGEKINQPVFSVQMTARDVAKPVQRDTTKPANTDTQFKSDSEKTASIIRDMLKDGIITSTDGLSFKIGTDEFVVNYQKQPEAVYQKYRARYVGKQRDGDRAWYFYFDNEKYTAMNGLPGAEAHPDARDERAKSMIDDLLKDGIITSRDNVSFKIGTDEFVVNYQKQPEAVYQKYRARYVTTQYSGSDDWIWYCNFDTHKWALIVAHKYNAAEDTHKSQNNNVTTGVFKGKLN
jgi:beta-lactamase regulating signal transducer with metallopeptidase domain